MKITLKQYQILRHLLSIEFIQNKEGFEIDFYLLRRKGIVDYNNSMIWVLILDGEMYGVGCPHKGELKKLATELKNEYNGELKYFDAPEPEPTPKKKYQENWYYLEDSMGRQTDVVIIASNLKEAYKIAKTMPITKRFCYWKLRRNYNGGARG